MASAIQISPVIKLNYGRQQEPIQAPIDPLISTPLAQTFLSADIASASATLTVKNITGFAINQILLIGQAGNQGAEIIKTHASTAPTGSTITLASNTVFPHSAGTLVTVLNFDQVEFNHTVTLTGAKTVLATVNVAANNSETLYNDLTYTTGYYFARFKNSITAAFSQCRSSYNRIKRLHKTPTLKLP